MSTTYGHFAHANRAFRVREVIWSEPFLLETDPRATPSQQGFLNKIRNLSTDDKEQIVNFGSANRFAKVGFSGLIESAEKPNEAVDNRPEVASYYLIATFWNG